MNAPVLVQVPGASSKEHLAALSTDAALRASKTLCVRFTNDPQPARPQDLKLPHALCTESLRVSRGGGGAATHAWSAMSIILAARATLRELFVDADCPELAAFLRTLAPQLRALQKIELTMCAKCSEALRECKFPALQDAVLTWVDATAPGFGPWVANFAERVVVRSPVHEQSIADFVMEATKSNARVRHAELTCANAAFAWRKLDAKRVPNHLEFIKVGDFVMLDRREPEVRGFCIQDRVIPPLRADTLAEWRTSDGSAYASITLTFQEDCVERIMDGDAMLNDAVVDWFMEHAARKAKRSDTVFCLVSDFARPDVSRPDNVKSLHGIRMKSGVRYMVAPACFNKHFVLLIVDLSSKVVRSYDSVRGSKLTQGASDAEWKAFNALDASVRAAAPRLVPQPTESQNDAVSCGIVVLELVRRFALGLGMGGPVSAARTRVLVAAQFAVDMHDAGDGLITAVRSRAEMIPEVRALWEDELKHATEYRALLNTAFWNVTASSSSSSSSSSAVKRARST